MLERLAPFVQLGDAMYCLPTHPNAAQPFQDGGPCAELAFALERQEQARAILKFQVGTQQCRVVRRRTPRTLKPAVAEFSKFAWVKGKSSS